MAGKPKDPAAYERVVATLPDDLRAGALAVDPDESHVYFGVIVSAPLAGRREIDKRNTDPTEDRGRRAGASRPREGRKLHPQQSTSRRGRCGP
jgi:hypothetical protein